MSKTGKLCPHCEVEKEYNEQYDVYYCSSCDVWLEDKCRDPHCQFCVNRPSKPSDCKE